MSGVEIQASKVSPQVEFKPMNSENAQTCVAQNCPLMPDPVKNWFALSVIVRHEKVVSEVLRHKGFATFLPLYTRRHQYDRRSREFDLPLFAGYVFCRFDPVTRLPILTTPGVIRIVGAGRTPIAMDPHEIQSLQKAADAGAILSPYAYWPPGQRARVIAGPLTGLEGVVVKAKDSMRLVLSVTLLRRSVSLEIDSECVASVPNALNDILSRSRSF